MNATGLATCALWRVFHDSGERETTRLPVAGYNAHPRSEVIHGQPNRNLHPYGSEVRGRSRHHFSFS